MSESAVFLILLTAGSISLLLVMIIVARIEAFISMLFVSVLTALLGGIPITGVIDVIRTGMGGILGYIAIVIGLGTMFGEIVQASGGAQRIADSILKTFGEQKSQWALVLIGLIIAIPVFFEVALILFIPLVYDLTRKSGRSILYYGIPLACGIAVAHAFIPPTPGPVAVASLLGADLGWVILIGLIAGFPAAVVGGIIFGKYIAGRINQGVPEYMMVTAPELSPGSDRKLPSFAMTLAVIGLPLALILLNTAGTVLLPEGNTIREWMSFIGHPFIALMIAALTAFYFLGTRLGFTAKEVQKIATKSMEPVGMIILVAGAGGVFSQVLIATGVGNALVDLMSSTNLPVILFAFLIAALVRVSQGSATVAMVTAAGLLAPVVGQAGYSGAMLGCIATAIACGATVLSHVNDTGFWLISQLMGISERDTLRSWTVMVTIVGFTGLIVVMIIGSFV
jgi:Gnt-I system low-affinity gluconate transporter